MLAKLIADDDENAHALILQVSLFFLSCWGRLREGAKSYALRFLATKV